MTSRNNGSHDAFEALSVFRLRSDRNKFQIAAIADNVEIRVHMLADPRSPKRQTFSDP